MKKAILGMVALAMLAGSGVQAQEKDLAGNWQGTLVGPGRRIVIKIKKDDGKLKGVFYGIDQGGQPTAMTSVSLTGNTVNFAIQPMDWTYAGTLNPDGNSISGSRTQGGQALVLNLQRVSAEDTWAIPEPPKAMPADAKPKFDVVTVKPSDPNRPGNLFTVRGRHVMAINTNVNDLITFAYGLHPRQIVDGPEWFGSDKFDIDGVPDVEGRPSGHQVRLLMQDVLERRFGLKFHHDQRELAVYTLTVGKGGPKMTVTANQPSGGSNFLLRGRGGDLMVTNSTMKDFCNGMQEAVMDKPVVDHTGLTDRYDFTLKWTADDSQFAQMGMRAARPTDDPNAPPSLYTAIQEQLGLKLESVKTMADVAVIDHAEKPSAN